MFNYLFDDLNKAFNEMARNSKENNRNIKNYIFVDAIENEDGYLVEAAIPGIKKENIELNYLDGVLEIHVKHNNEEGKNDSKYLVRERSDRYYKRSLELPGVDAQGIRAKYENGILSIVLPKVLKTTKTIEIE